MSKLSEALQIFLKYDPDFPTHCEHDILLIMDIEVDDVSADDMARLNELGFRYGDHGYGEPSFYSYPFGSA